MSYCYGGVFCGCPSGLLFPPDEVEAARRRVDVKRAIRRQILALLREVV